MKLLDQASWIKSSLELGDVAPVFKKTFPKTKAVKKASLCLTALGVYEAELNGSRVGDYILAPGWTVYHKRLQVQTYDITEMLRQDNTLLVRAGEGWCSGTLAWQDAKNIWSDVVAIIGQVELEYDDGTMQIIPTDESWQFSESEVRSSGIYNGEVYDARIRPSFKPVALHTHTKDILIPQEGEWIKETETIRPVSLIITPKGEKVIDFGQNLTGYVQFIVRGEAGQHAEISHAEVLDKEGNFYTENLRKAKEHNCYICAGTGEETYKPHFTFQGFRYIRIDTWPSDFNLSDFTAIVVHSDMKRTGYFECSNPLVNKLFANVIWGQRGNYLDIPTDCPQRDERLGWTGDAQAFIRAGTYNYNANKFFKKWLHDLSANQCDDGGIPHVIPNPLGEGGNSAAWADAAVICPWQVYLTYGDDILLAEQFESMKKWVEYVRAQGDTEALWNTGNHYGDWLGLDAPEGSYKGSTDQYLIATAFYAYSTALLIKAGKALGKDMSEYKALHKEIVAAFQKEYLVGGLPTSHTQTAHALTLYFDLAIDKRMVAASLSKMVKENGNKLTTGFVGTPYLLHVLSDNGYEEQAYSLMLQEEYPSWIYSVKMGATTIWEHWDGIKPDGSMWSANMNSFNHYAYGAVADWMYGVMAGINTDESKPGFKHIIFKPITDTRLDYVRASIDTRFGTVASQWKRENGKVEYIFTVPQGTTATVKLPGSTVEVGPGVHQYQI